MSTPQGPDDGFSRPPQDHGPQHQSTPPRVNPLGGQPPPQEPAQPQPSGPGFSVPPQGQGTPPPSYAPQPGPAQGYRPQQSYPPQGYQPQGGTHGYGPQGVSGVPPQGPTSHYTAAGWSSEPPHQSRTKLIALVVSLLVAVLLGAGAAVFFALRETTATPAPSPTVSATVETPSPHPTTAEPTPTPESEPTTPEPEPSTPEPSPSGSLSTHVSVGDVLVPVPCENTVTDPIGTVGADGYVTSGGGFRFQAIPEWQARPVLYPGVHQSNSQLVEVIPNQWMASMTVGVLNAADGFSQEKTDVAAVQLIECMMSHQLFGDPPIDAEVIFAQFNDDGVFFLDVEVEISGVDGISKDVIEIVTARNNGLMHVALLVVPEDFPEVIAQGQNAVRNLSWG